MTVRVGQAVDVVAQAGKPKTITGFQTHTTPVLLAYGERAELANEECGCFWSFSIRLGPRPTENESTAFIGLLLRDVNYVIVQGDNSCSLEAVRL